MNAKIRSILSNTQIFINNKNIFYFFLLFFFLLLLLHSHGQWQSEKRKDEMHKVMQWRWVERLLLQFLDSRWLNKNTFQLFPISSYWITFDWAGMISIKATVMHDWISKYRLWEQAKKMLPIVWMWICLYMHIFVPLWCWEMAWMHCQTFRPVQRVRSSCCGPITIHFSSDTEYVWCIFAILFFGALL